MQRIEALAVEFPKAARSASVLIGVMFALAIVAADKARLLSDQAALASRNSSGTMTAISGPFIPGTTISSSVVNARLADDEAELTNSLDRSGRGGMLAALRGIDGTVAAPALSFTSEPGSGLYRIGATDLGLAVNGVKQQEWTTAATTIVQPTTLSSTANVVGNFSVNTNKFNVTASTGIVGINGVTSTLAAAETVHIASTATQSNVTGAVGNNAIAFESLHGANFYLPGLVWFTSDNNATIPKAAVYAEDTAAGSVLFLGTSNNYASGITANTTVDQTGKVTMPGGAVIGSSGTAISSSMAANSGAVSPAAVSANSCNGGVASLSISSSTVGAPCVAGSTDTHTNLIYKCRVTASTTCTVDICNITTGSITPDASETMYCRVFNP
jgi:hypothetical protein